MCFSPEADFASGVIIGAVGVATLTRRARREIPLAILPLGFACHQIVEGFVWLGLRGRVSHGLGDAAVSVYLLYAWAALPVLVPLAVLLVEPSRRRRLTMTGLAILGTAVGAYLFVQIVRGPISAHIAGHSIDYRGAGDSGDLVTALYVLVTCGAFFASSFRRIVWLGIANLAACVLIVAVQAEGLTSLWCLWAALASVLVYTFLADPRRPGAQVGSRC